MGGASERGIHMAVEIYLEDDEAFVLLEWLASAKLKA